jgi:hypothetical protein
MSALGGKAAGVIVAVVDADPWAPPSSVTVSVTVKVPSDW